MSAAFGWIKRLFALTPRPPLPFLGEGERSSTAVGKGSPLPLSREGSGLRAGGVGGGGQVEGGGQIVLSPIGVVRSAARDLRRPDQMARRVTIELADTYAAALHGFEGFSHAIVLTWLDRVSDEERERLTEYPAGDTSLPEIGVLALRTHHRPNPVGVTVVRVRRVEGSRVDVIGLDAVDGTAVLDIKPYLPPYDSMPEARLPGWATGEQAP